MRRKKFNNQILGLCALSLIGMSSCIDKDYNLAEDVDMNITVGGDLTLPGSDTEEITLDKIFDLEENSIVVPDANSGNYRLMKGTDPTYSTVSIDNVKLDSRNIQVDKSISYLYFKHNYQGPQDITLEQSIDENSDFSLTKNDVTKELVKLSAASLNMKSKLHFNYSDNGTLAKLGIKKGFRITLPNYMTIETSDSRCKVINNHILEFNQDIFVMQNKSLDIDLRITRIDFSKTNGQGLIKPGVFTINDKLYIKGKTFVSNKDVKSKEIYVQLSTYFEIQNIDLTNINAIVDPKIDININSIEINNLPDFLTDDEVRISLADPKILLVVDNASPVSVNVQADLVPMKNGKPIQGQSIHIGHASDKARQIIIPNRTAFYFICLHQNDNIEGVVADAFVKVPNLNKLLGIIPEQIQANNIVAKALPNEISVRLGTDYNVKTIYQLDSPLQFNEGSKIVYSDHMHGWLKDTKDLEIKKGVITLDAENTIPMNMELLVDAVDADGNILEGVTAEVEGNIPAGLKENPSKTNLTVTLTSKEGSFRNLDGIKYRVAAVTDAKHSGITLNKNQALTLKNIKVKIIGGITVDLN